MNNKEGRRGRSSRLMKSLFSWKMLKLEISCSSSSSCSLSSTSSESFSTKARSSLFSSSSSSSLSETRSLASLRASLFEEPHHLLLLLPFQPNERSIPVQALAEKDQDCILQAFDPCLQRRRVIFAFCKKVGTKKKKIFCFLFSIFFLNVKSLLEEKGAAKQ